MTANTGSETNSAGNQAPEQTKELNLVAPIYDGYQDTQLELLAIETRKAAYKQFSIGAVLLMFNILAVTASGIPFAYVWLDVILFPVLFTGLGFLALKEPLVATLIGMILVFGYWIYIAIAIDITSLMKGWLGKAIIIYLLLAGLQNAREAHRIRKELKH